MQQETSISEDLIVGADAIAKFLGLRKRQIYHCAEGGYLPLFRIGAAICARRSTLRTWIAARERDASEITLRRKPD